MAWYQTAHHHSKCWDLSSLHVTELLSENDLIACYSTAKAAELKECYCSFARQGCQRADSTSAITTTTAANYSMANYFHYCSNSQYTSFCRICLFVWRFPLAEFDQSTVIAAIVEVAQHPNSPAQHHDQWPQFTNWKSCAFISELDAGFVLSKFMVAVGFVITKSSHLLRRLSKRLLSMGHLLSLIANVGIAARPSQQAVLIVVTIERLYSTAASRS